MSGSLESTSPLPPELLAPSFHTGAGRVWVLERAAEIDSSLRQRAFAHTGKDVRYYELVEQTLPDQFQYRYFLLEHEASGGLTVQPFFFVRQDLVAGLPARLTRGLTALRRRWPGLLTMRMLMVGCAAAEGQLGSEDPWIGEALRLALDHYAPTAGVSMVLLKDFPSIYRETLAVLARSSYRRVPSMPGATLTLAFTTFEEFMQQRLSKVYRKSLRRKFRTLEEAAPIELEVVTDGRPIAEELHALYLQTHLRSTMHFERLTPAFFAEIGERMPDRVRFFLWRQGGRLVAFSLCLVHAGIIHDLDVGLDYAVALDLHLYFVTLRDVFEWAVRHGVREYHTGPLNYDPKLHLKMQLAPLDLYARHLTWWINPIFKLALGFLEPTRHDPVLPKFANFREL